MGKKRDWLCVVKKAFSPDSKKNKTQETSKPKRKWLGNIKNLGPAAVSLPPKEPATPKPTPTEPDILPDAQNERKIHAYSVALATAMAAAAGVVAARAAADSVHFSSPQCESERSSIEVVHAASAQGKSWGKDVVDSASAQRKSSAKTAAHFASVPGESSEMIVAAGGVHAASIKRNSLEKTAAEAVHLVSLQGESSEKITAVHIAPAQRKSSEKTTAEAGHVTYVPGDPSAEKAAIKIQTAFRGYLARKGLGGLRRLKSYIQGQSMKQATSALRCMQTVGRVQSQIRARRLRMSEENQMLQQQLQKKRDKEVEDKTASVTMGSDWRGSKKSKEQSEAIKQSRQQAAKKRERALAYAFTHQRSWKVPPKAVNQAVMDQQNPHWGWNWFERWMAARPWEMSTSTSTPNNAALNTVAVPAPSICSNDNNNKPSATPSKLSTRPSTRPSLLSLRSKIAPVSPISSKLRQPTPSAAPLSPVSSKIRQPTPSVASISSVSSKIRQPTPSLTQETTLDRPGRQHSSIGGFQASRDDERLGISAPNSKTTTAPSQITKTRQSRLPNPLGLGATPEMGLAPAAKKRLSFPLKASNNMRQSGPSSPKPSKASNNMKQSGPSSPKPDNNTAAKCTVKKEGRLRNGGEIGSGRGKVA